MHTKIPTTKPVPANYMGVWQRDLLETATHKDDSSLVFWMQTQHYHIDIRIPAACTYLREVKELAEYNDDELLILASQQGFAGITVVTPSTSTSSDVCQWLRKIDFQPTLNCQPNTESRDIGKMLFTDSNTVIETGVDDAYLEVWRRLAHSAKPYFFSSIIGENRHGVQTPAYCMRAGKYIAYIRLRLEALPSITLPAATLPKAPTLLNLIQTNKPSRELLLSWLDMEISFGEILDTNHWQIKYSTLPFKLGSVITLKTN